MKRGVAALKTKLKGEERNKFFWEKFMERSGAALKN